MQPPPPVALISHTTILALHLFPSLSQARAGLGAVPGLPARVGAATGEVAVG